ncbi:hypothetical protein [Mycobacteroides abscessus]|uniref:hypothetical protein n=1 Tax=Mycobacteroides abscessus TaxID=36809 RepID=UPI00036B5F76|nr:hypothetical protein [Mycobacteroides abscessus]AMU30001.1 hypothetical protein A3N97_04880 [Mycobacteroides abscessus]ANN98099.1 hypothetical protein BAB74_04585 [Mycobacteroides abscessus]MBN7323473.1 hypothetical protein [Mycobacteroides abscessus subsp. massiliense]MBN7498009.1 hypothetical protein [Mycobacteroides abscessus subsp. abscessus]MDB2197610.1 hypothetical protein [Mycobacteroides abscessus subsp. abscessus]
MSFLQGPVVFIDDEYDQHDKQAFLLAEQIRTSGRPLAAYSKLPPAAHAEHWRSIAFLVLDWDLVPGSPGARGGSTLSEYARSSLFEWLENFVTVVFCPIFVVSAEDVNDIKRQINENESLRPIMESGRIVVFPKNALMDNFIQYLEEWVSSRPALAVLNIWANEYEKATNRLFQDMDQLAPDWPIHVWRTATRDGVDPSYELALVLSANLANRIDPFQFDIPAIRDFEGELTSSAMRSVSRGRTTLPGERLYSSMVLPGDIFSDSEDGVIWINIMPACQTVLNRPGKGGSPAEPEKVVLHLIRGERREWPSSNSSFNNLNSKYNGPNSMLIHTLLDDHPYSFSFKKQRVVEWGEVSQQRIARLLPPYITLMQQRLAAFLMNEGLPPVGWDLYK